MALTRNFLRSLGLEDDKINAIIEEHVSVTDSLKKDVDRYKADSEKLATVQKDLDELKGGDWETKYNNEHGAFETYKQSITAEKTKTAKEAAVKSYFQSKGIKGTNLDIALRGSRAEIDALELDGDNIKDTKALDDLVTGTYKSLVETDDPPKRVKTGGKLDNNDGGDGPEIMSLAQALHAKYDS